MKVQEIQKNQIEMWLKLTAELAEKTSLKSEDEITKRDIVKIAQKIEDIINVLNGKAKYLVGDKIKFILIKRLL